MSSPSTGPRRKTPARTASTTASSIRRIAPLWASPAVAWLNWHLKGQTKYAKNFYPGKAGLFKDARWIETQSKKIK